MVTRIVGPGFWYPFVGVAVLMVTAMGVSAAEKTHPESTQTSRRTAPAAAAEGSKRGSVSHKQKLVKQVSLSPSDKAKLQHAGKKLPADKRETSTSGASRSELAEEPASKQVIGATALVVETQSQVKFEARVDTGAASCSIHCEEWEIDDEADTMDDNIGKGIRVRVSNGHDESGWVDSRIERTVVVKTSEKREVRYKVPMTFRWKDLEKKVVVTLNNRHQMNFPLLLGRNFLSGDLMVDIDLHETD